MTGKRDYYEVLGVSRNADSEGIKRAYRDLARRYHPDVAENKSGAEQHFKEINEAFTVLSNPEKRAQYDRFGHAAFSAPSGAGGFNFGFTSGVDFFDDVLSTFFGQTGTRESREDTRGQDIRADLEITLEEAYSGAGKEIQIKGPVPCKECDGKGAKQGDAETCRSCGGAGQVREMQQSFFGRMVRQILCPTCGGSGQILTNPCKSCRGSGTQEKTRSVAVRIPAGVDDDNRIRMKNEGGAGFRGGPPGDLYVFIHIKPHPYFKREDSAILLPLSISFPEAALGNEIEVPTLAGGEKIQIPAGSQHGDAIRLKGKGMPDLNGRTRGDQYVLLSVEIPKKLSAKQKDLLQELARQSGINLSQDKKLLNRIKDTFS